MSATSRFEQEYSAYSDQLNSFKERANQLREIAEMEPEAAIQKVVQEVGTPIAIHLMNKGLSKVFAKGKDAVKSVVEKGKSAVKQATDSVESKVNEVKSEVESKVNEQLDRVTNAQKSIKEATTNEDGFEPGEESSELSEQSGTTFEQTFQNPVFDPNAAPNTVEQTFQNPVFDPDTAPESFAGPEDLESDLDTQTTTR